jgi:hypothetical protein
VLGSRAADALATTAQAVLGAHRVTVEIARVVVVGEIVAALGR